MENVDFSENNITNVWPKRLHIAFSQVVFSQITLSFSSLQTKSVKSWNVLRQRAFFGNYGASWLNTKLYHCHLDMKRQME